MLLNERNAFVLDALKCTLTHFVIYVLDDLKQKGCMGEEMW